MWAQGPKNLSYILLLYQAIGRKPDQNWVSKDLNQHSFEILVLQIVALPNIQHTSSNKFKKCIHLYHSVFYTVIS